ncbi:LysE family translocator [Shewanella cyperi]|uniref:LysE family translocator n=1 Tax=Shewanella cyperi TaxID=2814292 RepID=A0A974XJ95_9GAMM|nr:LysE family translocator [Shewanella cyperi]QSX29406.1 LysE family translocator [Shewanella cyperi]QSX40182.1 LysE family translocator [Shewanella cyperi]
MSPELWLSFITAALLLCFTPGPTVLLVMGQALSHGKRSVIPLVAGVLCSDLIAMSLSLAGVGALLALSSSLFSVIKWLGALYLIYLGIKSWRNKAIDSEAAQQRDRASIFRDSLLVTALNPKGIIFFMAFFPLFIDAHAPLVPQMAILACSFLAVSACSASFYALSSGYLRTRIRSANFQRRFNQASGGMLVGAGLLTATLKRA